MADSDLGTTVYLAAQPSSSAVDTPGVTVGFYWGGLSFVHMLGKQIRCPAEIIR